MVLVVKLSRVRREKVHLLNPLKKFPIIFV